MADYLKYTLAGYKDKQLTEALSSQSTKMKKKIDKLTNAEHCYLRKLKMPPEPKVLRDPIYDVKKKKKNKRKTKNKREPPGLNDDAAANDDDDNGMEDESKERESNKRTMKDHRKQVRITFNGGEKKRNTKFLDDVLVGLKQRGVVETNGHGFSWKLPGIMEHVQSGTVKSGRFYSDLFGKHFEDMTGNRELNGKPWKHPMDIY